ncbi:DEAD/DEAH box helicase [Lactobacillus paragasseri]|uniref:DEAD/DEAH box helicase family protein n=1 Tax=Lactobacillus paragasseri TaxID=2107999 RepID=A0ABD4ZZ30_9LACO|nr:DEAD/DEAH box helicase [Lactobacillus paragasseri]MDK7952099.1 DEAD/DEAH box helicase family protein [Lactobacillus paragasseri]MDO6360753.1 DEAD/DEAH box helicase family protein [Lactobacillus paragasseri]MDX5059230.1 DEAD/DEAH box helicase family protein [Lactobacillus paragasseri]
MQLRDYQKKLINGLRNSMANGHKNIMVQSPAGSGKSITMAEIAKRITQHEMNVLFVVHRRELVKQIKSTFVKWGVNMNFCEIYMVQTATRKLEKLIKPEYIFVDEAHHSLAKTYKRIFDYFPVAHVIGFTATPIRLSGKGFREVYDDLIIGPKISWLIKNHYLAPYTYYSVNLIDQKQLKRSSTGDYTRQSMENAGKNIIYGDVINAYKKLANNSKAIVYSYSVQSCKQVAEEFNKNHISAQEVDGKTDKDTRKKAMHDFRTGKIKVLVNAELYGEGVDVPDCQTVIMLRPTQSLSLFIQQSMRCMRYKPSKKSIIIDQVANYTRFGLPDFDRDWTLEDRSKHPQREGGSDGPAIKTCPECFGVILASCHECPLCGHSFEAEFRKLAQDRRAELEKINLNAKELRERKKKEQELLLRDPSTFTTFKELAIYGKATGKKPGWAWHMAKAKGLVK